MTRPRNVDRLQASTAALITLLIALVAVSGLAYLVIFLHSRWRASSSCSIRRTFG